MRDREDHLIVITVVIVLHKQSICNPPFKIGVLVGVTHTNDRSVKKYHHPKTRKNDVAAIK